MVNPPDNISILYKALKDRNFAVPKDESSFRLTLADKQNSDRLHQALKDNNFAVPDSRDQFYSNLFPQKKNPSGSASPLGSDEPRTSSSTGASPEQQQRLEGQLGKPVQPFAPGVMDQVGDTEPSQQDIADVKASLDRKGADNGVSRAVSAASTFDKSFVGTLTGIPKSIAIGVNHLTGGRLEDDVLYKASKWVEKQAEESFPENPVYQKEFLAAKVPAVAGTLMAFMMGGKAGSTSRVADLAIPAAKKAIMEQTAAHIPAAFMASAGTAAQEYERALQETGDENLAYKTWERDMFTGVPFLISPTFNAFNKVTNGALKYGAIEAAKGGAVGMFQFGASKALENLSAQQTYDKVREITDGVVAAGGSGFAINAVLTGLMAAVAHKQIAMPEDRINQAWSYVKAKQKLLQDQNVKNTDFYKEGSAPLEMVEQNGVWVPRGDLGKQQTQQLPAPKELGEVKPKSDAKDTGQDLSGQAQRQTDITRAPEPSAPEARPEQPVPQGSGAEVDKGVEAEKKDLINNTATTQGFFSDVVTGKSDKFKPVKPYEAIMKFSPEQSAFNKVYSKFKGNFDEHIATSIPAFRDIQVKKGQAIVDMLPKGGLMIDIAGSEGGLNKAITEVSGGKIRTQNLDVNPDMKTAHEATPVKGADYVQNSFLQDYTENGVTYRRHVPREKADVVHETMGFQFMSPQRAEQFQEVADNYLKKDGVFIVEQKVGNPMWDQNEKVKDENFKSRYYTKEQIEEKNKAVKVSDFDANEGMAGNMVTEDVVLRELNKHFSDVRQYWDAGNFKGYIASNDSGKVDKFMDSLGSTNTEFSNRSDQELIGAKPIDVKKELQSGQWAIVTAENQNAKAQSVEENAKQNQELLADLRAEGYNPVPAKGTYAGNTENSFFVKGLSQERANQILAKYKQESALTDRGLLMRDGSIVPSEGLDFSASGGDYTEVGGVRFNSKLYTPSGIEKAAGTEVIPERVQKTVPNKVKIGDKVDFIWLGAEKSGTVVSVGDKIKIKSGKTTYPVDASSVGLEPDYSASTATEVMDQISKIAPKLKVSEKPATGKSGVVPVSINPLVVARAAWKYFNKAQEITLGRAMRSAEDWMSRAANKGVESRYWSVRSATQALRNLIGGLSYSQGDLTNKLQYNGNKNYAHIKAKLLAEDLYRIVDSDDSALARVHAVLDPEMYVNDLNLNGLTYQKLNATEKSLHDAIRFANNFVHEWSHDHGFIDDATYEKYKGKYIARLYEMFELVPPELREGMKSGRADFSMYTARKDNVNLDVLRDPVFATAKRLGQILQNEAVLEYAKSVANSKNIRVSDTEFPGAIQLGKPGQKPFYGDLTGKYVPQYIAEDFRGFFYSNAVMQKFYDAFRDYDRLALRQFLKKSHTVYSPLVQLGNFTANYSFAFWTGVDPVTYTANLFRAGSEISKKGPMFVEAVKNGLIGADIMAGDLVPAQATGVKRGGILGIYDKFSEKSSRLYSGSDDIAKLSSYMSLRESGYSEQSAAQQVYEGFQNYATVGKSYDFASKTPIFGNPYIKFKADLGRIIKNAVTRRPLTAALYLMLLSSIKDWLSEQSGEDPDVKAVREYRSFTPKIKTPFFSLPMVWQTPVGEVNFARFMTPYYVYDKGDANSLLGQATDWAPYQWDYTPAPASKDSELAWPEMPDVLLGTYVQALITDQDFRGKSVRDPLGNKYRTVAVGDDEKIMNVLNYISRSQIPFFRSTQDMISAYRGEGDFYGRERTITQALVNNIIKVQEFGPEQAKKYLEGEIRYKVAKFQEISKDVGQLRRVYADDIAKIDRNKIMTAEGKDIARAKALERFNARFLEKLEEQKQIAVDLENPTKLYDKLK